MPSMTTIRCTVRDRIQSTADASSSSMVGNRIDAFHRSEQFSLTGYLSSRRFQGTHYMPGIQSIIKFEISTEKLKILAHPKPADGPAISMHSLTNSSIFWSEGREERPCLWANRFTLRIEIPADVLWIRESSLAALWWECPPSYNFWRNVGSILFHF